MKRRAFFRSTLTAAAALSVTRREALARIIPRPLQQYSDVTAVTGDGRTVTLTGKSLVDLAARLRGQILVSGDEGYDEARQIFNPAFDKYPALIAQVTGPSDIRAAVDFARDNGGLLLAVKCGGHSASGQSTCDRGMMIDLTPFRGVHVDPMARRARVAGGSLLGQLDHETMAFDLVTPMGTVSHTGVGGLVTGGGFGRVARRFGMSIDNVVSVDVVTADGQFRRASLDENSDLFWGIRGGGGNFGIVTSFEFRLHPMQRTVVAGRIMYPISRARDVLSLYADYGPQAPDELQLDYGMFAPAGGSEAYAGFAVCYSGPANGAGPALAPLRRLGTPAIDQVQAMDYVAVQRSGDIDDPRGIASYLKSGFLSEFPQRLVSAIVDGFEPHPARTTQLFFQQSGGEIGRVSPVATAFVHRDSKFNMLSSVAWRTGDDPTEHIRWIREYWADLEPFTSGFYVNDAEIDATAADVSDNYRQNHTRLAALKNRYDPKNLFRLNANVKPTG